MGTIWIHTLPSPWPSMARGFSISQSKEADTMGLSLSLGLHMGSTALNMGGGGGSPGSPPVNTVRPGALTGTLEIGQTLTSPNTGTWTGDETITYARQWYRADPVYSSEELVISGGEVVYVDEAAIAGETAATYLLADADLNKVIFCRVTGTNDAGSTSADSPPTASVILDPAAATALAAITTKTDFRKTLYNSVFLSLRTGGVLPKLDALHLFAAANAQAANVNLVNPAAFTIVPVNSPTFTADRGYAGNGSSSYVGNGFNPSTAPSPKFVRDSAMFGLGNRTNQQTAASNGSFASGGGTTINPRNTSDQLQVRVNESSAVTHATGVTDARGRYVVNRSGASATQLYKNGALVGSGTGASIAPPSSDFTWGQLNGSYNSNQYWFGVIGSSLDATEQAAFDSAMAAFGTAVGAI